MTYVEGNNLGRYFSYIYTILYYTALVYKVSDKYYTTYLPIYTLLMHVYRQASRVQGQGMGGQQDTPLDQA